MDRRTFPHLPNLLEFYEKEERAKIMAEPVPVRKGLTNLKSLGDLLSNITYELPRYNGLLRILPRELVVGVIPDFTLGRGKEVMPYLSEEETTKFWFKFSLNEWSSMGHIVPNFEVLVQKGLGELLQELKEKGEKAGEHNDPKTVFYRSTRLSIEGVQGYIQNWKTLADNAAKEAASDDDKANMEDVSQRLAYLVENKPRDFQEAVQLIYSMHCCLHLVGELTAMSRLDQILWPFLEADVKKKPEKKSLIMERAQDISDCLFIKMGDNAFVNRAFIYDYLTFGTTTVNGHGGNFAQGGGTDQWV
jgi:pyruvate-formate lyase